jgi:hypothetical protein
MRRVRHLAVVVVLLASCGGTHGAPVVDPSPESAVDALQHSAAVAQALLAGANAQAAHDIDGNAVAQLLGATEILRTGAGAIADILTYYGAAARRAMSGARQQPERLSSRTRLTALASDTHSTTPVPRDNVGQRTSLESEFQAIEQARRFVHRTPRDRRARPRPGGGYHRRDGRGQGRPRHDLGRQIPRRQT